MAAVWAAGLLLRRLRAEAGVITLIVLLVAVTGGLFAAAPRLFNRVADEALRYAVRIAPEAQRNISFGIAATIAPGPAGGVSGVRAFGDGLATKFPASIDALVSDRILRVTTVRLYLPDPPSYETHISLRYQDGLTERTRLVSGRWPVDRGVPLEVTSVGVPATPSPGPAPAPIVLEAALASAVATEIGVRLGDRLGVTLDGSDALNRGVPYKLVPTQIEIVGLYEPLDVDAEYWRGDTGLVQVVQGGDADNPIAFVTAYISAEIYPSLWRSALPFRYQWRFLIDPARLNAGDVAQLQVDLRRLGLISGSTDVSSTNSLVVVTSLPEIVDRFSAERQLTESILSIAAIGPFGLAAGAMAMVALLLVARRRGTLTLARGRGASGALLLGTQLWESIVLAGGAAMAGLLLAIVAVPARASPLSVVLAIAVGVAATLLLIGASWSTARRGLGQLERDDPPPVRASPRRLVIEATIVFVAVAAAVLLRQRGLTITSGDETARAVPLLASVPVLSGLAGGIVALRLYPLAVRGLGWLAARQRDIVPVLSLRTAARQSAAANLPLLVLMLTAAFGAFSLVTAASLDRGQVAASYLNVGADYRIERVGIGGLTAAQDPGTVAGVEAVARGIIDPSALFSSAPSQHAHIYLEAVDPAAYSQVVAGTAANPGWPAAFVAPFDRTGLGTAGNPIPAIASSRLPTGSTDLGPGDTFEIAIAGRSLTFELAERRATFPGIVEGRSFIVAPFDWVAAAFGDRPPAPSVAWVRAPGTLEAQLRSTLVAVTASAHLVSRYAAYDLLNDAPLVSAITWGYAGAVLVAAIYMALTIVGALVLSAAHRTRDLAYLRTLGVTARQALALTILEHAPPVVLAILPGLALGIAIATLVEPGLGLATFVGHSGVPLFVDWPALGLLASGLIGLVGIAVVVGTWLARRSNVTDALRIGDD